jgi:DNA-binding transcriptional regulator YiaG
MSKQHALPVSVMTKKPRRSTDRLEFQQIAQRVQQPTPAEIRAIRKAASLTQAQAAALVSTAQGKSSYRAWQGYEAEIGQPDHRAIPLASWELFLLLTNQHPSMLIKQKTTGKSGE